MASGGLGRRLDRAFLLQVVGIGLTALVSVWAAAFTIEEVLVKQALAGEARYFWDARARDTGFPVPNTRNLTGYFASAGDEADFPAALRGLTPGYHRLSSAVDVTVAFIEERSGDRLALVFDGEQVRELSVYFGLVPLGLVLTLLYLVAWLAYRAARRAVSPVEWLAREVHRLDPERPDASAFSPDRLPGRPDTEVVDLADALGRLAGRVNQFLERERNFTRDASHELRSPLTVIRLAADMLLSEQELERPARNSVLRIKRAVDDMEELTDAFLLLARESERGLALQPVWINDVVTEEIERVRVLLRERPVTVRLVAEHRLQVMSSDKAISVLVGNLLRNAVNYTEEGEVVVHIGRGYVEISDSGPGISSDEMDKVFHPFYRAGETPTPGAAGVPGRPRGGHGVGLTIVKRFSDRFGWPVRIDSRPGEGTRVVVEFPDAQQSEVSAR